MRNLLFFAAVLAAPATAATNLVVNGDFSAGNAGFSSAYTYAASGPTAGVPEGVYLVDTNAANVHPSWYSFGDHTTGIGNYLIVNGATSTDAGDSRIAWEQTITVAANTKYFFEAFAANTCCNASFTGSVAPSNLTFEIVDGANTTTLNTFTTNPAAPGVWAGLSNTYTTGNGGLVTIRIRNSNLAFSGNDFAIDDINFSQSSVVPGVPEAATWAMMIVGFGLVGVTARRRSAAVAI